MTKPIVRIHNLETNEITEREMTSAEIAEANAKTAEAVAKDEALEIQETLKAALLNRLGLTAEEAKLLLS